MLNHLRATARKLKLETTALYYAAKDPRTPMAARVLVGLVVAYALSPIDLIPDFIPVLGLLDDLILVPLGIRFALRMVPADAMAEARVRALETDARPSSPFGVVIVITIWLLALLAVTLLFLSHRR